MSTSTTPYRRFVNVGLHNAAREAAGVVVGDEIQIKITRDDPARDARPARLEKGLAALRELLTR
jgi:hypothetical protein